MSDVESTDLSFEDVLKELLALVGRTIAVGVHGGPATNRVQLAGFAGQLLNVEDAARFLRTDFGEGDRLIIALTGGTPAVRSVFYLASAWFESARWHRPGVDDELVIEVRDGAFTITVEDDLTDPA